MNHTALKKISHSHTERERDSRERVCVAMAARRISGLLSRSFTSASASALFSGGV